MANEHLTAIVPIGPSHLKNHLIKHWADEANANRDILKIILVEDYSSDEDLRLSPKNDYGYLLNYEVLRVKFGSPGKSRNKGLEHAASPWISFWDSDDIPQINTLLKLIKEADEKKCQIVIGNYSRTALPVNNFDSHSDIKRNLSNVSQEPGIWRMAFEHKIIENKSFTSHKMAEDQIFLLELDLPSQNILFSNQIVYKYSTGSELQLTSSPSAKADLENAIKHIIFQIRSREIARDFFSIDILVKLLISSMLRNSIKLKLSAVLEYLKLAFTLKGARIQILQSTFSALMARTTKH